MKKPWIEKALQEFDKTIIQKRLPHALIIYGNEDIGKLELAQNIVKTLSGVEVAGDNLMVNDNKILIRNSSYAGLIYCQRELSPNLKISKTSKVAQTIGVNQIRAFCNFLEKTSSKIQIGIINTGDFMHISASNALLKTLEEPRKNTIIIILAHKLTSIPITILSRCQKLHLLANSNSKEWIKNNIDDDIPEKTIDKLLKENNNTPSEVVAKINNQELAQEITWKKQLLLMAINPNNINSLENIKGNELRIMNCLENMLIACIEIKSNKTAVKNSSLKHILQNTQIKMLFNLLSDVSRGKSLTKTTINISLLLDNLLIVWSHITHLQEYPKITNDFY